MARIPDIPMPSLGVALPAILIMLLVVVVIFVLPINPTLTVTFSITSSSVAPPQVQVTGGTYSKSPLWSTTSTTKGTITITYLSGQGSTSTYQLNITITYAGQTISTTNYPAIVEGLYQMYVVYLPSLGERASIPYLITFTLTTQLGYQSTASATLYP
jgi:uncharacterized protein (UPF0333 family)